jgi:hypothetical protein
MSPRYTVSTKIPALGSKVALGARPWLLTVLVTLCQCVSFSQLSVSRSPKPWWPITRSVSDSGPSWWVVGVGVQTFCDYLNLSLSYLQMWMRLLKRRSKIS